MEFRYVVNVDVIRLWVAIVFCLCRTSCTYLWEERWYENMPVDHFSYDVSDTFRLRYLINTSYWDANGGPIFVYCGNEGSIEGFANNTGFMWDNAEQFRAMLLFIEHRYYGKSLPYGNESTKHLGKLSSSQALADFAVLISWLKSNMSNGTDCPVIAFGGSYGGMLAAWMRIKYPHIVYGAIAASAPVAQFPGLTSCSSFGDITSEVFRNVSASCAVSIKRSWRAIRKLGTTVKGRHQLVEIFKLCNESALEHEDGLDKLVDWLTDIYGTLAMVNYPYETEFLNPVPGWPVKVACDFLNTTEVNSTELLRSVYRAVSVYLNYTGSKQCNSLEPDYGGSVDGQLWDYQSCSEMMMPMCSSEKSMFEEAEWNLTIFSNNCYNKFEVRPTMDWAAVNYGGRNLDSATNIVFSNGWLDPWRGGGVLTSTRGVTALIVEDGAHHYDLRGRHPKDTQSVQNVRLLEAGFIKKWLQRAALQRNRTKWWMSNGFTPGWNDPPVLPASPSLTKCVSARSLLNRRVYFPIHSSGASVPSGWSPSNDSTAGTTGSLPALPLAVNSEPALHQQGQPPMLPPAGLSVFQPPATFFCGEEAAALVKENSEELETAGSCDEDVVLTNEELISILEQHLATCTQLTPDDRESIVRKMNTLKQCLETASMSDGCRKKFSLLVQSLSNQKFICAYELHTVLMLNHFSEVHSWMAGVKALILECQKQQLNNVLLRIGKNAVDRYNFWEVEKSPGPSRSKQSGKRKLVYAVRPKHLRTLRAQMDCEYDVMRCLASPYLNKMEEEIWHKSHGNFEEQQRKNEQQEAASSMPGKPKFVTGKRRVDNVRGNIGNLLHEPRTLEQHFSHLTSHNAFE